MVARTSAPHLHHRSGLRQPPASPAGGEEAEERRVSLSSDTEKRERENSLRAKRRPITQPLRFSNSSL